MEDNKRVYKWRENSPATQFVLNSINCKCIKVAGKTPVSVFGNSVLIGHLIKWLAVDVAMT